MEKSITAFTLKYKDSVVELNKDVLMTELLNVLLQSLELVLHCHLSVNALILASL